MNGKRTEMNVSKKQMKILKKSQRGEADAVWMYRRLALRVPGKDGMAFLRLANDEKRHEEIFYKYTGKRLRANPMKAFAVPLMYRLLGKEKVYPIIAKGEYAAAEKYKHIIADFPEVERVMNDEKFHGDAVMNLLE